VFKKQKTYYKQGIYKPIHKEKYKGDRLPEYRSSWELHLFRWFDGNSNVLEWTSEHIVIPYVNPFDKKIHRYFVDNTVLIKEGDKTARYLIEVKPKKQTEKPIQTARKKRRTYENEVKTYVINRCKWKAAQEWCKHNNYKWQILTEDHLNLK
tara:strand:+ start:7970 stop:8425 length:456 start_codon:yes stop_codon:yes gene_type:complete